MREPRPGYTSSMTDTYDPPRIEQRTDITGVLNPVASPLPASAAFRSL